MARHVIPATETGSDRRSFLKGSAVLAGSTFVGTTASARAAGANERFRVAVIGTGGQGKGHVRNWLGHSDVDLAYVCDVDDARRAEAAALAPAAKPLSDLRRVLDDPSIDVVSIATPDHWHTPAALLALDAGKHVYVEKPCSHNVREGRMLIDAQQRTGRLVQHGTQTRSSAGHQEAFAMLREGAIGDVLVARAWNIQFRPAIGKEQPSDPPAGFDYDTWVGPAPMVPFQKNRHHYSWHWWYDFGTGDAGNDGVHELDLARWGLGVDTQPARVAALGGKYAHDDDQQFPDTITAVFEYPAADASRLGTRQLIFEMRLWSTNYPENVDNGVEFIGTGGRMFISKRGKFQLFAGRNQKVDKVLAGSLGGSVSDHQRNLLEAIRGQAELRADAHTAHLSASLAHLANTAARLNRSFEFDAQSEQCPQDAEANALLARKYRTGHWGVPAEAVA
ncbi:MAG: Gfo/Idh/MocA family oxidoreductase [Planctomycetaceae bacterium]|nr:Gfo/Idh/MocA family oxidoreductase [Planctomycetaceae bacterium]